MTFAIGLFGSHMLSRCIDIHHHYFPPDLDKEKSNAEVGWVTPKENLPWSPDVSLRTMDAMKIDMAILSFPALSSGSVSEENRSAARKRNAFVADICSAHPDRFGFFATVPFLNDIGGNLLFHRPYKQNAFHSLFSGCLEEIGYALDHLNAQGVSLASSYGEGSTASMYR